MFKISRNNGNVNEIILHNYVIYNIDNVAKRKIFKNE